MKRLPCLALLLAAASAIAQPAPQRHPSEISGVDLVVTYEPGPPASDYAAETASALAADDPRLLVRGLDRGLVRLVNEHSRQVRAYTVSRERILGIAHLKHDMTVLDRVDLVFTRSILVLVHTTTSNAGLFTGSDVFELPFIAGNDVDRRLLAGKTDLLKMLDIGLATRKAAR